MFVFCDCIAVAEQEINIVEPVEQAMLLVGIDVEMLGGSRGKVGDGLGGQVD